ncbi:glycosyl hydrolase family 8 [Methylobacterium sp. 77]|uniref:glycosyl hydrolase family 8 n=1 Tax=Methylobacterium sp. 77 TaxID=1101192 RepID=UPI000374A9FB|nr:glycosyl hydrolase family 8 [Methylobacterium sp. 77]
MTRGLPPFVGLSLGVVLALASAWIAPARAQDGTSPVPPSTAIPAAPTPRGDAMPGASKVAALVDSLKNPEVWRAYRSRFVTEQGRVVDTANGMISHSEGQGYGMLLAVAANDRATFERLWGWTRANLMVRSDALMAWRWEPAKRPAIADLNNASDGDILVAWALTEAAEAWDEASYRVAARRIAVEIARKAILFKDRNGALLLPAVSGFSAAERADGPLINLSYWVFPAFARLPAVAPEFDWAALTNSGLNLLRRSRFGPSKLPTEWISLKGDEPRPADGFPPLYSYNAIRIPLYLVWAGIGRPSDYEPFVALWSGPDRERLPIVDTADGRTVESLSESGYTALSALLLCDRRGTPLPDGFGRPQAGENYYPTTLHLLAMVALQMRNLSCQAR